MKQKILVGIIIVCAIAVMALSIASANPYGYRDLTTPLQNNQVSRWYNPTFGYLPANDGSSPMPYPYWMHPIPEVMPL